MKSYHVHIYQVSGMCEMEIDANNHEEAKQKAFDRIKKESWALLFSDCKHIAITFEEDESG